MEKAKYEQMLEGLNYERPMPYFPPEDEAREFFEELKKEYPKATMYEKTGMGCAICIDDYTRMVLAEQITGAEQYILYAAQEAVARIDDMEVVIEQIYVDNKDGEESDAGGT